MLHYNNQIINLMSRVQIKPATIPTNNTQSNSLQKLKHQKKNLGNSQFIRSKFDINYDPKLRVFNLSKSHMDQENILKRQRQREKYKQLSLLVKKTQEEVKSGKKIVIDWSQKNSFRTTRFPSLGESLRTKRSNTEQDLAQSSKPLNIKKKIDFLKSISSSSPNKQISNKSEHLRQLIAQSVKDKKLKRSKLFRVPKSRAFFAQNQTNPQDLQLVNSSALSIDPHFNISIIQEVQKRQKQFFQKNNKQIMEAINYELKMNESLKHDEKKYKNRLLQVHQRIICKSKLTLLKSDLAKKFKQIRDVLFQQSYEVPYSPKQSS